MNLLDWYNTIEPRPGKWQVLESYERAFSQLQLPPRYEVKSLLELGVWNGSSMLLWKSYFPYAKIIGVEQDVERYTRIAPEGLADGRIIVEEGDCTDATFMKDIVDKYGPFDIIIDDASHYGLHQITSLGLLCKAATYLYFIEDIEIERSRSYITVLLTDWLKICYEGEVERWNHRELLENGHNNPRMRMCNIKSIHLYYDLLAMEMWNED